MLNLTPEQPMDICDTPPLRALSCRCAMSKGRISLEMKKHPCCKVFFTKTWTTVFETMPHCTITSFPCPSLRFRHILCIVELLFIVQVFCLQKVIVNGTWLNGIDEIQHRETCANLRVLYGRKWQVVSAHYKVTSKRAVLFSSV